MEAHNTKTLEEAKPEILQKLRPETARHELEAMEKNTNVQMDDSFFGPAAPKPPPPFAPPRLPPPPNSAGRLFAGTSGFSYPAWKPEFYPKEVPAKKFLEHYATG